MSLDRAYEDDNVFAKIIRGELPCAKIYEDDDVLAIMDAYPQARGHALVIPKGVHAVNMLDTPQDVLAKLIVRAQIIGAAIVDAFSPKGIRVMQFNGAAAGQSVFHTHFHIVPVYADDEERPHASEAVSIEELQGLAAMIRARVGAEG